MSGTTPPSDEMLRAFDRGQLPPDEIDAVARWLEAHPEGEERLRQVADGTPDAAVQALREPCALADELAQLAKLTSIVVDRVLAVEPVRSAKLTARMAISDPVPRQIRDYQLLRPLGSGGMGGVFVARHTRLQRDVALKLLLEHVSGDPCYRARFEREMAIVGQLDHPNLIRAHDAGADGTHLFLVMELLEGRDLGHVVAGHGPLSVPDACAVVRQAALGLHHAHEHGLVHRDVKPANLFLTRSGVVKVIDLGLARATTGPVAEQPLSSTHTVLGTPDCMAPEQWEKAAVDRRADLYALGCTLFILLTGRPPFQPSRPDSWVAWLDAHRSQAVPNLRDQLPEAPAALAGLVARLLAKEPQRRPATAQEVADALAVHTAGHDLPALLSNQTERTRVLQRTPVPARSRRHLTTPILLLGAIVLLGVVGLSARNFRRPADPQVAATDQRPAVMAPRPAQPIVLEPSRTLRMHTNSVVSVAFSPDGKVLASGGKDRVIYLWDTQTWTARGPLRGHPGDVSVLAFTPDSARLSSASSHRDECLVRLWDVAAAQPAGMLGEANTGMWSVAIAPDGETVACGGWDGTLHVWSLATRQRRYSIPKAAVLHIRTVSISSDGRWLASGGSGPARLWELSTGREIPVELTDGMNPIFVPGQQELAGWEYHGGRVILCAVPSGQMRAAWRAHTTTIEGLAVSPDGRFLASVGADGAIRIWDSADQHEVANLVGHKGSAYSAAFTPDGKQLATAGVDDLTVRIWDLAPAYHGSGR